VIGRGGVNFAAGFYQITPTKVPHILFASIGSK